jgi:hypothetical protein
LIFILSPSKPYRHNCASQDTKESDDEKVRIQNRRWKRKNRRRRLERGTDDGDGQYENKKA